MIKWFGAGGRRKRFTHEQLLDVWETVHAPHIVKVAQPRKYRITFFEQTGSALELGLDGMAQLWYDDDAHFDRKMGSGASSDLGADGFRDYMDGHHGFRMFTEELVNVDGAVSRDTTKLTFFVKRRAGVSQADLFQHWREVHIPNIAGAVERTPEAIRYVVSLSTSEEAPFDGVAEIYLDKADAKIGNLIGIENDGFGDLCERYVALRGFEVAVVG